MALHYLQRLRQAFPAQAGAQHVVALHQLLQRSQVGVQAGARIEGKRGAQQIGVAFALEQMVEQDAFLRRRQRIHVLHVGRTARHASDDLVDVGLAQRQQRQHWRRNLFAAGGNRVGRHAGAERRGGISDHGGQRLQAAGAEHRAHIACHPHCRQPLQHLQHHQRVAAQFEEMVVAAHALQAQQLLPDLGDGAFQRALRRLVLARHGRAGIGCRQGLAVQLAIRHQRQGIEHHEGGRHHVRGHGLRQLCAHAFRRQHGARCRHQISHQALRARHVFARHDQRLAHALAFLQPRAHLPQLDAKAPDLDLEVIAAQVSDIAIGEPAGQVAGAVQASAGDEGIGKEALGVQLRALQVAARHAGAAHVDFTGHAGRHRLHGAVEDVNARIGDRPADRQLVWTIGRVLIYRAAYRRLGGAIRIEEAPARRPVARQSRRTGIAADDQRLHRCQIRVGRQRGQGRRRQEQMGQGAALHGFDQRRARQQRFARGQVQAGAGTEGQGNLPDAGIETARGKLQHAAGRRNAKQRDLVLHQVPQASVVIHHALRLAGGTGGIDHVGQVLRVEAQLHRIGIAIGRAAVLRIEHQGRQDGRRQGSRCQCRAHQRARAAIGQHVGEPLGRIVRVERHKGGARLHDAQHAGYHVHAALDAQGDPVVRLHAHLYQVVRQPVGLAVQLRIAERTPVHRKGDGAGVGGGVGFEQLLDWAGGGEVARAACQAAQQLLALCRGQGRQPGMRLLFIGGHLRQQRLQVAGPALDAGTRQHVRIELQFAADALLQFEYFQHQRELGVAATLQQRKGLQAHAAPFGGGRVGTAP